MAHEPVSAAPPRRLSLKRLAYGLTPIALLGLFFLMDWPICPSRILLGVPCPGCGLTRASSAMVSGELGAMLRFHPLAPLVTPLVLFVIGRSILVYAGAIDPGFDPLRKVPNRVWGGFVVLLIGLWVARAFGLFGGLPDPLDLTAGLVYRGARYLLSPLLG